MVLWYFVTKDGTEHGPEPDRILHQEIKNGNVDGDCEVWNETMEDWVLLNEVPALKRLLPHEEAAEASAAKEEAKEDKKPTPGSPPPIPGRRPPVMPAKKAVPPTPVSPNSGATPTRPQKRVAPPLPQAGDVIGNSSSGSNNSSGSNSGSASPAPAKPVPASPAHASSSASSVSSPSAAASASPSASGPPPIPRRTYPGAGQSQRRAPPVVPSLIQAPPPPVVSSGGMPPVPNPPGASKTHDRQADWGPNLVHQVEAVKAQVNAGQHTTKAIASFLKKASEARVAAANQILNMLNHDFVQDKKLKLDSAASFLGSFHAIAFDMQTDAEAQRDYGQAIILDIADPLLAWLRKAESSKASLFKEEETVSNQVVQMDKDLMKDREKALKEWDNLKRAQVDLVTASVPVGGPGGKQKNEKAVAKAAKAKEKQLSKTYAVFAKFERTILETNVKKQSIRSYDLPNLISKMQALELERLEVLDRHLNKLRGLRSRLAQSHRHQDMLEKLEAHLQAQDARAEVAGFGRASLQRYGSPPAFQPFRFDLACPSDSLSRDSEHLTDLLGSGRVWQDPSSQPIVSPSSPPNRPPPRRPGDTADDDDDYSSAAYRMSGGGSPKTQQQQQQQLLSQFEFVVALHDFRGMDDEDLHFRAEDIILVTGKLDKDWWRGCVAVGTTWGLEGLFPACYTEPYDTAPEQ